MNSDGSQQINLTHHPSNDRLPSFSNDTKKIAFVSDRDHEEGEIYIMNSNGENVVRITNNALFEESPTFTRNGKKMLFTRRLVVKSADTIIVENGELFLLDLKTKKEIRLTNKKGYDSGGVFLQMGKKLLFMERMKKQSLMIFF